MKLGSMVGPMSGSASGPAVAVKGGASPPYGPEEGECSPPVRTGRFAYLTAGRLDEHMARGWMTVQYLPGPTHGFYSILAWHCECGEVQP